MNSDWRVYRPAIWLAMLGVALMLLLAPVYIGAVALGAAIGVGAKIHSGRRRALRAPSPVRPGRRRR